MVWHRPFFYMKKNYFITRTILFGVTKPRFVLKLHLKDAPKRIMTSQKGNLKSEWCIGVANMPWTLSTEVNKSKCRLIENEALLSECYNFLAHSDGAANTHVKLFLASIKGDEREFLTSSLGHLAKPCRWRFCCKINFDVSTGTISSIGIICIVSLVGVTTSGQLHYFEF